MGVFIGPIEIWIWSVLIFLSITMILYSIYGLFFSVRYFYDYILCIVKHPVQIIITIPFIEEMIFRFPWQYWRYYRSGTQLCGLRQ